METPYQRDSLVSELLAEFAGTLILILFGCGVVAQVVAAGSGEYDSITWAWGLGVTLGVYTAARISGAHLNPAVTVTLRCSAASSGARSRRTRWPRFSARSSPR